MNSISKSVYTDKYQNIKIFLQNVTNWFEGVFVIKKVKNTVPWTYLISDLKAKKLLERFRKKNCKKEIKKGLELKK